MYTYVQNVRCRRYFSWSVCMVQESCKFTPKKLLCLPHTGRRMSSHCERNALCSISNRSAGCWSISFNVPEITALRSSSDFADCFVKESLRQRSVRIWAKSSICPEHASFLNICIMWMVSLCSGKCVLEAVVTRLFASVRRCTSTDWPDISVHSPLNIWQVPKNIAE